MCLWFGLYPDGSGMFFAFWVMLVIGYPTMFFLALPAWGSTSARGGVGWMRLLFWGIVLGSVAPALLGGFAVCGALLDRNKYILAGAIRESVEMLLIGACMGITTAVAFKLIAYGLKSQPS